MVEGHQDLAAKLESRLDVQSLADWKTAAAAHAVLRRRSENRARTGGARALWACGATHRGAANLYGATGARAGLVGGDGATG